MLFRKETPLSGVVGSLLLSHLASAQIDLDITSKSSIVAATKQIAAQMWTWYPIDTPGYVPGTFNPPYYWWECGAMMGQLIHHWFITGDTTYNDDISQAILFQTGTNDDFMPANQTKDLGNDDQVFWAFTAMDAAELGFPNPPSGSPSWLSLAQGVFNDQVQRWQIEVEDGFCGGGLRWQIYPFNTGYSYKNCISSGGLFQLSARLARYTGNSTYATWAETTFDWIYNSPIVNQSTWQVFDGTHVDTNCTDSATIYWTYNVGTLVSGAAYMYNYTNGSSTWQNRLQNLVHPGTEVFFVKSVGTNTNAGQPPQGGTIMCEVACEPENPQGCDYDQPSFKAYLSRWLAVASVLAPFTAETITPLLQASAQGAAQQCSGRGQNSCGRRWYQSVWDGYFGPGEQMSAMSVMQNLLIGTVAPPLTLFNGGNSSSNPTTGGSSGSDTVDPEDSVPITTGDRAGAGILTATSIMLVAATTWWMIS